MDSGFPFGLSCLGIKLRSSKPKSNEVEPGPNIETVKSQGRLIATVVSEDLALL